MSATIPIRDLQAAERAKQFLVEQLRFDPFAIGTNAIARLVSEQETKAVKGRPGDTLSSRFKRDTRFRTKAARKRLQNTIIRELFHNLRLPDDDHICLGKGGCRAASLKEERHALVILGPPASGKSRISTVLADWMGAVILDSDYAKRKLPEFATPGGGGVVHRESSAIIDGDEEHDIIDCLFDRATDAGANIVYPRVGRTIEEVRKVRARLLAKQYSAKLVLIDLDPVEAARRSLARFLKDPRGGRYVSLGYIHDEVADKPRSVYDRLRIEDGWNGYEAFSNDVPQGRPPAFLAEQSHGRELADVLGSAHPA